MFVTGVVRGARSGRSHGRNKGERFDDGGEYQAKVVVDLSIAKHLGVDIVNLYAVESDRFKIAYDKYFERDDIHRPERMVAEKLVRIAEQDSSRWPAG